MDVIAGKGIDSVVTIRFDIPSDKINQIVDAMSGLYPIPEDENDIPLFSRSAWAKEAVRRNVIRDVRRWQRKQATKEVLSSITNDNDLLT